MVTKYHFLTPIDLLSGFLPTTPKGRDPDNNFVGFGEKPCLHKIITVKWDFHPSTIAHLFFTNFPQKIPFFGTMNGVGK